MNQEDDARRVVLKVPDLDAGPLGGGCCSMSREDILLEELDSWSGLLTLEVDLDRGTVAVLLSPRRQDLAAVLDALAARGLPATVIDDPVPCAGQSRE